MTLQYTSVSELSEVIPEAILGKITRDTAGTGPAVELILRERLKAAENTVDGYLGTRYRLPLIAADGTVPPEIKDACLIIAKYKLYARRNALTPGIENEYQNIMGWLKDVSTGKANIALIQADKSYDLSQDTVFAQGATYVSKF